MSTNPAPNTDKRYDVVIVSVDTSEIAAVVGINLLEHKADIRENIAMGRINDGYFVGRMIARTAKKGERYVNAN